MVMMKFANTVTNLYAFNCLGAESVILRNKRVELTSKKSEFAEIGMKAALAAAHYPKFDRFCDGTIEAEDIARAFAGVEGVDWETAYMIARNILNDADTEPSLGGEVPGLNYIEFMTCLEGDSIDFGAYLKDTKDMYGKMMQEFEKEDAEDAAEDAKKAGKKPPPPKPTKEPTAKQKMKAAQEAAKLAALQRKAKVAEAEAALRAKAAAEGKDYDEFMEDKERAEAQAMREKCKAAFEEALAEIEKNRPANPEKEAKKAEKAAAAAAAADGGGGGGEAAKEEEKAAEEPKGDEKAASPPAPGDDLGLDDAGKEERAGKKGTLKIHLECASGLAAKDKGGTSDPYVNCKLGKKAKACKPIMKTLAPTWNEDLEFVTKVSLKKVIKEGLTLDVMDKDQGILDSDDLIGKVTADLAALATNGSIAFNEAVSSGGVVTFSVKWEEGEESKATAAKKEKKAKEGDEGPRAGASLEEDKETTQTL